MGYRLARAVLAPDERERRLELELLEALGRVAAEASNG
jgi:hypothetical protein